MNKGYIKYPVAYNVITKLPVDISDVTKDIKRYLICPECRDYFVAVQNHRTPHFKHKPYSNCTITKESYIHWLTKEVFRYMEEIEIPELFIDDLPEKPRQNFQSAFNRILDSNVPGSFRSEFRKGLKQNLTESRKLSIDKIDIEEEFKTSLGDIRVDVVANSKSERIFIEPYFTNEIDEDKKSKLSILNIPTLSLNLKRFIDHYSQDYSIRTLREYLFSKKSKQWVYISDQEYEKHVKDYENYLIQEIENSNGIIDLHKKKLNKLSTLEHEQRKLIEKAVIIDKEIYKLENKINKLRKELGPFS